jgi:hypothetical protein
MARCTFSLKWRLQADFADSPKNDTYHEYAAAVSAVYALSFIREYESISSRQKEGKLS